ncbi:MAG: hypothetical protein JZU55_11650 [Afipia sp.]|jgi:ElaB/YqjD/DUF883 family membrane-anchored ribosome-binding protein|nr:hypothetical protein [Afipia sp.]
MPRFDELENELQTLKNDVMRSLSAKRDEIRDTSKANADALAVQIKSALNELGTILGHEEERIENIISDRPIATLASAFALGIVVGAMLGRSR